jgi:hypothetical protein
MTSTDLTGVQGGYLNPIAFGGCTGMDWLYNGFTGMILGAGATAAPNAGPGPDADVCAKVPPDVVGTAPAEAAPAADDNLPHTSADLPGTAIALTPVLYTPPHNPSGLRLDSLGHSDSPRTLLGLFRVVMLYTILTAFSS